MKRQRRLRVGKHRKIQTSFPDAAYQRVLYFAGENKMSLSLAVYTLAMKGLKKKCSMPTSLIPEATASFKPPGA